MAKVFNNLLSLILIYYLFFYICDKTSSQAARATTTDIDDYIIIMNSVSVTIKKQHEDVEVEIIKDINEIIYKGDTYFLNPNYFLCKDESNHYHLFAENIYYDIQPNSQNNEIGSLSSINNFESGVTYMGYIKEKALSIQGNEKDTLCPIEQNEIIIYGKQGEKISFNYTKKKEYYSTNVEGIGNVISCKMIESSRYICAYFVGNNIVLSTIAHVYTENNKKGFKTIQTIKINRDPYYDNLILYDTNSEKYKILCASKRADATINCFGIRAKAEYDSDGKNFDKKLEKRDIINPPGYHASLYKTHNCYFTEFNLEFLLCCGSSNKIHCYRKTKSNFDPINEFSIYINGNITNLIIHKKEDHAIISYKNETSTEKYLYHHYIYPPKCFSFPKI